MITQAKFYESLMTAYNNKTLYVKGGFGLVLNKRGKERAINSYDYNKKRAAKINAMPNDSFGFDCCGLVKGCAGGYSGDMKKVYGGAIYNADHTLGNDHDIPDVTEKGLIEICSSVTKCKKVANPEIPRLALLWMTGHCGVYLGDNKVIESTPSGSDGVQITEYNSRNWMKWGLLPFVEYSAYDTNTGIKATVPPVARPTLRIGSKGLQVYYLQQDLNYRGADLDEDGMFGTLTYKAVKQFQKHYNLDVDGIYGPITHRKMIEVIK